MESRSDSTCYYFTRRSRFPGPSNPSACRTGKLRPSQPSFKLKVLHPHRNAYAKNSLRIILRSGRDLITYIYVVRLQIISPRNFLCNGQSHEIHTKFRLSKCNFLTGRGLHEIYVMSRRLIPQESFDVCNVFELRGHLFQGLILVTRPKYIPLSRDSYSCNLWPSTEVPNARH